MRTARKTLWFVVLALVLCGGAVGDAGADTEKSRLRNELGITYAKEGHLDDALRSFTLILAEQPEHAAALNNSANVYFVQGEVERAQKLYERAIQVQPFEGGIRLNLGILLHSIGDSEASAAAVRRGLELIGDPHEAYYLLGLSSQPPGDNSRAADASDLQASEIEELLARAMADIPTSETKKKTAASTPSAGPSTAPPGANATLESHKVSTRPGGAKASQVQRDIVADRLFWMAVTEKH